VTDSNPGQAKEVALPAVPSDELHPKGVPAAVNPAGMLIAEWPVTVA